MTRLWAAGLASFVLGFALSGVGAGGCGPCETPRPKDGEYTVLEADDADQVGWSAVVDDDPGDMEALLHLGPTEEEVAVTYRWYDGTRL